MTPVVELARRKEPDYAVTCIIIEPHLTAAWPFVRQGLAKIKARQERDHPGRSTWTPEHVLRALRASLLEAAQPRPPWEHPTTQLWLAHAPNDRPEAFAVTQVSTDPWLNVVNGLFVWMAYAAPDARGAVGAIDAELERVARVRGFTHLEALTARPGLGRRMARHGWETVMTVIRKDLYAEKAG